MIALLVTALAAHFGSGKMVGLIPFVLGMGSGYIAAVLFTVFGYEIGGNEYFKVVDFSALVAIFKDFDFGEVHHLLLLFGRYFCTAKNPKCDNCEMKDICKEIER